VASQYIIVFVLMSTKTTRPPPHRATGIPLWEDAATSAGQSRENPTNPLGMAPMRVGIVPITLAPRAPCGLMRWPQQEDCS
jgi:hypothetical protein